MADRFDLRKDIDFNTSVQGARYDESSDTWTVTLEDGGQASARYLVTAVGCLSASQVPDFEGLGSFSGPTYHTGRWPHEGVDFTGQRVAVIGTGSSGIQAIPMIAQQAAHLTVFQRTPNFSIPAQNRPLSEDEQRRVKAEYRQLRADARLSASGVVTPASVGSAPEDGRGSAHCGARSAVGDRRSRLRGRLRRHRRERGSQPCVSRFRARPHPHDRAGIGRRRVAVPDR
ncbi:SidA/IucD/PvdA family monooxygenase [Streptomyces sp. UG1]|uniref:SidA/IucD/PvdA family monooxygenase n=1 Tax=Streptomyces sp. UG1 TaxID=3417652 RepID=UPI003CE78BC3